jgi:hypothetical protein
MTSPVVSGIAIEQLWWYFGSTTPNVVGAYELVGSSLTLSGFARVDRQGKWREAWCLVTKAPKMREIPTTQVQDSCPWPTRLTCAFFGVCLRRMFWHEVELRMAER